MATIFELSEKSGISVKRLKILDKLGALRHDASTTELDEIRDALRIGNRLSVGQLVHLIEKPAGILELGKYAGKAEAQLGELDKPEREAAPLEIAAQILGAYEKEPEAITALVGWLKTVIPARPVPHAYIATRLLLGVPEASRKYDAPRLRRVMDHCRSDPAFDGWHRKEKAGASRFRTVYEKSALDL